MFGAGASPHIYANIAVVFWWHYHHLRPLSPSLSIQQLPLRPPALQPSLWMFNQGSGRVRGAGISVIYIYIYIYIYKYLCIFMVIYIYLHLFICGHQLSSRRCECSIRGVGEWGGREYLLFIFIFIYTFINIYVYLWLFIYIYIYLFAATSSSSRRCECPIRGVGERRGAGISVLYILHFLDLIFVQNTEYLSKILRRYCCLY